MRLLVSVRSAAEARAALEGGADIIDAKEPARGPLGPVTPRVAAAIVAAIPDTVPFSAALGDPASPEAAAAAVAALPVGVRAGGMLVKVGLAGAGSMDRAEAVVGAVLEAASRHPARPGVITVAYADLARVLDPFQAGNIARGSGASGVLLDTWGKTGPGLLDRIGLERLVAWTRGAREVGLLCALAGGLRSRDLATIAAVGCDVVGFRGAACEGGRDGRISSERVRELRREMESARGVAISFK